MNIVKKKNNDVENISSQYSAMLLTKIHIPDHFSIPRSVADLGEGPRGTSIGKEKKRRKKSQQGKETFSPPPSPFHLLTQMEWSTSR